MTAEALMIPQQLYSRGVLPMCLQGAVCHQCCSAKPDHAMCSRAIVKWNIFYISSNGFSLLINWAHAVCIFQDPSKGRTFHKRPLEAPPRGISVSVWTGNVIRAHMFIKYGLGIWATTTAISCLDTEYLSVRSLRSCLTWKLWLCQER